MGKNPVILFTKGGSLEKPVKIAITAIVEPILKHLKYIVTSQSNDREKILKEPLYHHELEETTDNEPKEVILPGVLLDTDGIEFID